MEMETDDGFLDEAIGDNFRVLADLLRSLKKEEDGLCGQLGGKGSSEVNAWQDVVGDAQSTLSQLQSLKARLEEVQQEARMEGGGEAGQRGACNGSAWEGVGACVEEAGHLVEQVREVDKLSTYLTWVRHVQHLCTEIESDVDIRPGVEAVKAFHSLRAVCRTLSGSGCQQLTVWLTDTRQYWRQRLCHNLSRWFTDMLEQMEWPFTTQSSSLQQESKWDDNMKLFQQLFTSLLQLDQQHCDHAPNTEEPLPRATPTEHPRTPDLVFPSGVSSRPPSSTSASDMSSPLPLPLELMVDPFRKRFRYHFMEARKTNNLEKFGGASDMSSPLPLPLELMVDPFRKRFRYHFMEARKTNNLEKPEWYLTQVSNWLRDHTPLLEERIQPILDECPTSRHISAKHEFGRGLVQEVKAKLEVDLVAMVIEDSLMAHLVDELLLFDHELRIVFPGNTRHDTVASDGVGGTSDGMGVVDHGGRLTVLDVLLKEAPFDKWRNCEKSYAVERLHEFTEQPDAWSLAYESVLEADLNRVPQCTQQLMILMKEITDHYRDLPSARHQILFLELQVDLLLEFHCDLSAAVSQTHPLHHRYPAYLNTCHYIHSVLHMWVQEQFFMDLWEWSQSSQEESEGGVVMGGVTSTPILRVEKWAGHIDMTTRSAVDGEEEGGMEACVFTAVMAAFRTLQTDMEKSLLEHTLTEATNNCHKYRAEKWHSLRDSNEQLMVQVSAGANDLLTSLRETLTFISDHVSPLISQSIIERLATHMDTILLNNVILANSFNEGGVQQLNFDLQKCFIPMLAKFSDDISRKSLYEKCTESVTLLSLPQGSACLLLEVLKSADPDRSSTVMARLGGVVSEEVLTAAVDALNEVKVHALSPQQARCVLQQRLYSDHS